MGRYDYKDITPLEAEASGLHASYIHKPSFLIPITTLFDHTSHMAGGSIPTGVGSTLICLCLTLVTIVTSSRAVTHVAIDTVLWCVRVCVRDHAVIKNHDSQAS